MRTHLTGLGLAGALAVPMWTGIVGTLIAQPAPPSSTSASAQPGRSGESIPIQPAPEEPGRRVDFDRALDAVLALPVATLLGAALAFRPRRRGTPKRSAPIVQTQIILALIGALVMLVVGSSLARAFGVVGAAGLVRYRARVDDPKDAGVMLSTLAVGLASGVGLYAVAVFATLFIVGVLWVIESFEPEASKFFILKIATGEERAAKKVEDLLRRFGADIELRSSSSEELSYEVRLPKARRTDRITKALLDLPGVTAVDWEEEKKKRAEEIP